MNLLDWLPLYSRRHIRKLEATWRRRVHAARPPGYIYSTDQLYAGDPTAIYVDMEDHPWNN